MVAIPDHIAHYEVRREIGRGGMGVVYLARDGVLDRDVAIKALGESVAGDAQRLARFKREARLIAQLNHPHIAQIYHLIEEGGTTHLVLEYVPGRTLAEMIDEQGPLDPESAASLCVQVARALEAAHARGIVHRDLKPSNVRVTEDGTAKILDFGIARGNVPDDPAIPREAMVGTPGYMSPEQARGEAVDGRTDIFSFGCILYECLAGRPAFAGASPAERIDAALTDEPDWSCLPPTMSEHLYRLLRDCLRKDAGSRLQSVTEAVTTLETALGRHVTPSTHARAVAGLPHNLPEPTTSFVGRGDQLHELADLLARERLVTLTGGGGSGKTRMSLELARRVLESFPDGAFLVELASTIAPEFVPGAVSAALGVKDQVNRTTVEALCDHLAGRHLLLVLDNCEHVLGAAADLAAALLRAAPGLRILATSRENLGLPGERVWRVPGLALPPDDHPASVAAAEAVTLFVHRARAFKPTFTITESNAATIASICSRLDGIPLAIELAAARMKMLTPEQIETRLDDRFRLLAGDGRGVAERHRTLQAAVDWSYEMLTAGEQRMLRRLSVFAGGWTLEGAVAVCGPGGRAEDGTDLDDFEVLDGLTRLVDKSLVIAEDAGDASRYRMLETVRLYAARRLDETDEAITATHRHLDYCLALVEQAEPQFTGAGQALWIQRIEAEHDNMLAALQRCELADRGAALALRLCRAMMRFWLVHGHYKTGLSACTRALQRPAAAPRTADRAGTLHAAAVMAQALGEYAAAMKFAAEALSIREELDDRKGMAQSLNSLGNSAYYQGNLAEAQRLHDKALAINRMRGDRTGIATSLNNLANVAVDCNSFVEAQRLYEEALDINRHAGHRASEAINLNNLGLVALHRGDLVRARTRHEESLAIRRDLADPHGIAESLTHLAKVARDEGDLAGARRLHEESLASQRDLGDKLGIADSLDAIAMLATRQGEHRRAARLLGAGEQLRARIGSPRPRPEQQRLNSCVVEVRETLGSDACDELVDAGRAASLDDTIAATLQWLQSGRAAATKATTVVMTRRP